MAAGEVRGFAAAHRRHGAATLGLVGLTARPQRRGPECGGLRRDPLALDGERKLLEIALTKHFTGGARMIEERKNPSAPKPEPVAKAKPEKTAETSDETKELAKAALANGDAEALAALMPDCNRGFRCLVDAAGDGDIDRADFLATLGAMIDGKGDRRWEPPYRFPVFAAAAKGQVEMIDWLAAEGADVNAEGADGFTALDAAVDADQPASVAALMRHGADPNHQSRDGSTPMKLARKHKRKECLAALKNA